MVLLVILTSTVLSTGCVQKNIFLESDRSPTVCDQWGGAVSMTARAEAALPDQGLVPQSGDARPSFSPPAQDRPAAAGNLAFFAPPQIDAGNRIESSERPMAMPVLADETPSARGDFPPPGELAFPQPDPSLASPAPSTDDSLSEIRESLGSCETRSDTLWSTGSWKICRDHRNYYSGRTLAGLGYGLALGSILANTSLDEDFQDWYQDDVRSAGTDELADWFKSVGDGWIVAPAAACLAVAGVWLEEWPAASIVGDFGCRVSRAYMVGAPPMVFMQYMLGGTRPDADNASSHWEFFDNCKAVSGHAFIGAAPFITAARMTDSPVLKSGLYACSVLPAWSRLNDDRHYLSQVILGWWMAYLACRAIDQTESDFRALTLVPIASADGVGIGAVYEY